MFQDKAWEAMARAGGTERLVRWLSEGAKQVRAPAQIFIFVFGLGIGIA